MLIYLTVSIHISVLTILGNQPHLKGIHTSLRINPIESEDWMLELNKGEWEWVVRALEYYYSEVAISSLELDEMEDVGNLLNKIRDTGIKGDEG